MAANCIDNKRPIDNQQHAPPKMGCMFSRRISSDFEDVEWEEDATKAERSARSTGRHNDITDGGATINAPPGRGANVLDDDSANSSLQNAKRRQQQSARILMTANAAGESGRSGQQPPNTLRLVQSMSLANLLAQGRKVIQLAVKVNAIDSVQISTPVSSVKPNGQRGQQSEVLLGSMAENKRRKSSGQGQRQQQQQQRPKMAIDEEQPPVGNKQKESPAVVATCDTARTNNSQVQREESVVGANEEVVLFTSIRQLCMKIIKGSIVRDSRLSHNHTSRSTSMHRSDNGPFCVFLFGAQGSCKGELAFELVQHSPLLRTLVSSSATVGAANQTQAQAARLVDLECPLYHHIDVAALIIKNIDSRIREYIQLQFQAIHSKQLERQQQHQEQSSKSSNSLNEDQQEEDANLEFGADDDASYDQKDSTASDLSDSLSIKFDQLKEQASDDDFSLITLSTKQRSVLELKLIKYSNCVTSKWVLNLIELEVERIELKVKQALDKLAHDDEHKRLSNLQRVYLINLVPNQLSLFKCCLYLHQQELKLDELKYWSTALKFERRTNIRVMTKERAVSKNASSSSEFRPAATIKTITSSLGRSQKKQPCLMQTTLSNNHQSDQDKDLAVIATDALASGLNEKLGPKLNCVFVQQFKLKHRLYQVRYNRSADSQDDDEEGNRCGSSVPCPSSHQIYADERPDRQIAGNNGDDATPIGDDNLELRSLSAPGSSKLADKTLSSSMQNLYLSSPTLETSTTNPSSPRLSLSVSPSAAQFDRLSPNSMISSSSSLTNNSLVSSSALATSTESLSSLGYRSPPSTADRDELEHVVEIQIVDLSGEVHRLQAMDQQQTHRNHDGHETKLQRWRHRHFKNIIEHDRPACLGYYIEPRRGFTPLVTISRSPATISGEQNNSNQLPRSLLNTSPEHRYMLILSKISDEDQSPDLPARKSGLAKANIDCLEVKRIHSRMVKLKSISDLEKLAKLIKKARRQLDMDTRRWLTEAVVFNHYRLVSASSSSEKLASARFFGQTHPGRVIYTLRLGLHRLKFGQVSGLPENIVDLMQTTISNNNSDSQKTPSCLREKATIKSILKSESKPQARRKRPASSSPEGALNNEPQSGSGIAKNRLEISRDCCRPASSLATGFVGQNDINSSDHKPRRNSKHVQFMMIRQKAGTATKQVTATSRSHVQATKNRRDGEAGYGEDGYERRLWISEDLFVSSSVCEDKSLLEVAAALIKIYFSGQWRANK